jgi:tRNA (guanine-N7-)-methyltransferase
VDTRVEPGHGFAGFLVLFFKKELFLLKPPADRLYGRQRTHALRPRQQKLLHVTLPRLAWTPADAFTWLEVGFGGGEHTRAQIAAHPEAGLIACEVFEQGLCSLLAGLVPEGGEATAPLPPNLRVWPDDARTLLRALPEASLDRLFLLFPDPWPKARHAKRRFVHPETVKLVASRLRRGAEWRIATDDPTYQAWVTDVMSAQTFFPMVDPATSRPLGWPPTRYEAKALAAGRTPLYWRFIRA